MKLDTITMFLTRPHRYWVRFYFSSYSEFISFRIRFNSRLSPLFPSNVVSSLKVFRDQRLHLDQSIRTILHLSKHLQQVKLFFFFFENDWGELETEGSSKPFLPWVPGFCLYVY